MWKEKVITKKQVVTDFGEVLYDGAKYTVKEREDCPFRSITDLKGYDDSEINTKPSDCDTSGYVDNRVVIDKIMRNVPLDVLAIYTKNAFRDNKFDADDITSEDDYDDESMDICDIATDSDNLAGAIAEALAKDKNEKQKAETSKEQALASDEQGTA